MVTEGEVWWHRCRWWYVPVVAVLLVISGQTCTSASLSVSKDSSASKSNTTQLQDTTDSWNDGSPSINERKQHDSDEGTIVAGTHKVDDSEDNINEDRIEIVEMRSEKERISNYENLHKDVLTLEEVKRKMEEKDNSPEVFRPDVVENKLQRLLAFFDPAKQDGRSGVNDRVSLWEFLVNYVTGNVQPPLHHQSYTKAIEEPPPTHPCDNVPGSYNQWFRNAVPRRVVVAGGGVAGLAALTTLIRLKVDDVLLLEATDRMGGRVKTVVHGNWVAEEGPGLIQGGRKNPIYQIAREEGALGEPVDNTLQAENVVTSRGQEVIRAVKELHASIQQHLRHTFDTKELEDYYDKSLGEFLSSRHQWLWGPTRELSLRAASEHIIHQGVNIQFGSYTWFNISAHDADNFMALGQDHTWQGGMEGLVHTLMNKVPKGQVRMLNPVCKVYWDLPDGLHTLVVTADGSSYLADHVLIMLPLGVLRERHSHTFEPPLPTSLSRALTLVEPGTVNQINLGWASPWWGSGPFHMDVFWNNNDFPPEMDWVSNIVQVKGIYHHLAMLQMKVTGEASFIMERLDPETIISHLITFLRATNKNSIVPLPLFFHRSKSGENMWARGSYQSYVTAGRGAFHLKDRSPLAARLYNSRRIQSVFFGGEHTSTTRFGTVDGAFLSGVKGALWVTDQLWQEGGKNNTLPSNCPQNVLRKTYYNLYRHPERYQGIVSCDNHDRKKVPKKRKRKMKNIKKKNKHTQFVPEYLFQRTKSNSTQTLQKNLAKKTVSNGYINKKRFITTPNEEFSKVKLLNNSTDRKNTPKNSSGKQIKVAILNNRKNKKETSHLVPYEKIIEMLIERLSESTEDFLQSEESYPGRLVAQRKKSIMKKKIKLKKRRMHKNKGMVSPQNSDRSSVSVPQFDRTLNISGSQHSINNEQNSETHLHVYLSHPKNLLNLTTVSDQKDVRDVENNGKIILDKEKTPQSLSTTKLGERDDQQSIITYNNFHLQQDQQNLPTSSKLRTSLSSSEVENHFYSIANWDDDPKMANAFTGHLSNNESFLSSNYTPLQSTVNHDLMPNATQSATRVSSTQMQIGLPLQKSNSKDDALKISGHVISKIHSIEWGKNNTTFREFSNRIKERKKRRKYKRRNKSKRRPMKKQQKIKHFLQEIISKKINDNIRDIDKEKTQMTSTTEPSELNEDHANTKSLLSFLPYFKRVNVTSMLQPVRNLQPSTNTYSTLLISPHHEIPRLDMENKSKKQNYSDMSI
ncbi:uncharacterized protein LOC123516982 [Portunus trituberculatus]|uniref:uncharacterized protein LOC123516982 n=1 Tax=Portunus trituberculatus TaxID=210409 RepID=UPI001E1CFDD4|nr:uncharacterized protein LOC123516982 [Portunus trituberculatus]XP_045132722.1 uncharacterized protein LOC123516982 [Portunus trituberculatus]